MATVANNKHPLQPLLVPIVPPPPHLHQKLVINDFFYYYYYIIKINIVISVFHIILS